MKVMAESAFAELQRRQERERLKAFGKYGAQALDPGGDPSRDVLDYALGELAGLERYAEMIEARFSKEQILEVTIEELPEDPQRQAAVEPRFGVIVPGRRRRDCRHHRHRSQPGRAPPASALSGFRRAL